VVTITSPEGVIHYGYDDVTGWQTKMWTDSTEVHYAYDPLGRTTSVTEVKRAGVTLTDPQVTSYTYTEVGQVRTVTVSAGTSVLRETTNTYDDLRHWLTGVENKDGSGNLLSSFVYVRRADGQVTQVDERVKQSDGGEVTGTTKYQYDAMNRLVLEEYDGSGGSDFTTEYKLDLVGNRISKVVYAEGPTVGVATESVYDERDRLKTETTGSTVVSYGYDKNGSLKTQSSTNGDSMTYTWDVRGRLSSATVVKGGVTTEASYQYDVNGIRSGVTENGVTTKYVLDQMSPSGYPQVVEEWSSGANGSPILLATFVYGRGLNPIGTTQVQRDGSGNVTGTQTGVFLADGHSGVRQAVDAATGAVILTQGFDAFGGKVRSAGGFVTPIGYRGERWDRVTGTWDTGVRQYNPLTNRFNSMDPFSGNMRDPSQWMRYGYAGANPIWGMDPSGMMTTGQVIAAIGIGATYVGQGIAAVGIAFSAVTIASGVYQLMERARMGYLYDLYSPVAGELPPGYKVAPYFKSVYKVTKYITDIYAAGVLHPGSRGSFSALYRSSLGEFGKTGVPQMWANDIKASLYQTQTVWWQQHQQTLPGGDMGGRVENAARHLTWQIVMTLAYGRPFSEAVGEIHEYGDYTVDSLMDIHNNELGREIADGLLTSGQVVAAMAGGSGSFEDQWFSNPAFRTTMEALIKDKVTTAIMSEQAIIHWGDWRLPRPQADVLTRED
jgi:RHS repeat-associated protein